MSSLQDVSDHLGKSRKATKTKSLSLNITFLNIGKWYVTHDSNFSPQANAATEGTLGGWSWSVTKPTTYNLPNNLPDGEITLYLWTVNTTGDVVATTAKTSDPFLLDTTAPVFNIIDQPADNAVDASVSFHLTTTDSTQVSYSYCLGSGSPCSPFIDINKFPLVLTNSQVPFGSNSITIKATDELNNSSNPYSHTWTRYRCTPNAIEKQNLVDGRTNVIGAKSKTCAGKGLTWGPWQVSECAAGYDSTQDSTVCSATMAGFFSPSPQTGRTDCSTGVAPKPNDSHWKKSQRGLTLAADCTWDCNNGFYKSGSSCTAVADGFVAAEGATQSTQCRNNKAPNQDKSACTECPTGKHANSDNSDCELNTKSCNPAVTDGQGSQNWNFTLKTWNDCQIISCTGGYDNADGSTTACALTPKGFYSPVGDASRVSCSSQVTLPSFAEWTGSGGADEYGDCSWDCSTGYEKNPNQNGQNGCVSTGATETFLVTGLKDVTDSSGNPKKSTDSKSLSIDINSPNVSKWYITHNSNFDPQAQASIDSKGTTWNWLTTKPSSHTLPGSVDDGEITLYLWTVNTTEDVATTAKRSNTFLLDTLTPEITNVDFPPFKRPGCRSFFHLYSERLNTTTFSLLS